MIIPSDVSLGIFFGIVGFVFRDLLFLFGTLRVGNFVGFVRLRTYVWCLLLAVFVYNLRLETVVTRQQVPGEPARAGNSTHRSGKQ